ncbi:MAG: PAS domain S-box-containing protein [Candidatus Azotimanducaceae bacterium]|jgi:PAS domain S-box-containing protein
MEARILATALRLMEFSLAEENSLTIFDDLLAEIISVTKSEFGFIGSVLTDNFSAPYIKVSSISNIAWDKASRDLYKPEGMEFRNLNSLFGQALLSEQFHISNDPVNDPYSAGLPHGHPPLTSFIGIPVKKGSRMIGFLGLGNRVDGFDEGVVKDLGPYLTIMSFQIDSAQIKASLTTASRQLENRKARMQDSVVSINSESIITSINPAAEELFEYQKSELIGKNLTILMPENMRAAHSSGLKNFVAGHPAKIIGKEPITVPVLTRTGKTFPIEFEIYESYIDGEQTFVGYFHDPTTIAKMLELKNSYEPAMQRIEDSNSPVIRLDLNLAILNCNQSVLTSTGLSEESLISGNLLERLIDKKSYIHAHRALNKVLEKSSTEIFEARIITADKSELYFLISAFLTRDILGAIVGITCVCQNITETIIIRAEVDRNAKAMTQLIETANAPIFSIDSLGNVNVWNQKMVSLTGYSRNEVLGKSMILDVLSEEHRDSVQQVLSEALGGEETSDYEVPLFGANGKRVDLILNATTIRDSDGEISGVIGVGQDITELREKELESLQTTRLEALGQLTGGVAHDFNNLLTIIQGNLSALRENEGLRKIDGLEDIIDDALSAAYDGAKLSAQLLSFARKQKLVTTYVDVEKFLPDSLSLISRAIKGAAKIELKISPFTGGINIDQNLLENALINLAINARDSIVDNGKIILSCNRKLVSQDESELFDNINPGSYVFISMEDNGTGISEENQKQVFEPFFSTKGPGLGSGLGLSMVQGFIIQSGGAVDMQSELGKGTIISLVLPAADNRILPEPEIKTIGFQIKPDEFKTVLVVEDDARVRRYACRTYVSLGFHVLEAEDASRAMAMLATHHEEIDLLFSDIIMPGNINGRDLAQHVLAEYPDIKVLLTSGFEKIAVGSTSQDDSQLPILKKPFSKEDLSAMLIKMRI